MKELTIKLYGFVCWREVCWCKGQSDEVEEAIVAAMVAGNVRVPTGDPGICDDCWASMHREGGPVAHVEITW